MLEKKIGKIQGVKFGMGGYQDVMIGCRFDLGGKGWGTTDFWGTWSSEPSANSKWTSDERNQTLGEIVMRVSRLLADSGKSNFADLEGVPIEVEFDGMVMKSWRILTEVL